tara:strand:+ start:226 stop:480 length:255 start_codon:yes stop_codon:yes gene_type:complete
MSTITSKELEKREQRIGKLVQDLDRIHSYMGFKNIPDEYFDLRIEEGYNYDNRLRGNYSKFIKQLEAVKKLSIKAFKNTKTLYR